MATTPVQFTAFTDEPPTIAITSGVALVRYRSGGCCTERAMSVRNLERGTDRCRRALERYAAGETDIIVDD